MTPTYFVTFQDYLIYRKKLCLKNKVYIGPNGIEVNIPNDRSQNLNCLYNILYNN